METAVQQRRVVHVDHVLVSTLNACCAVQTLEEFRDLVAVRLRALLPHSMTLACLVDLSNQRVLKCINTDFDESLLQYLLGESRILRSPLMLCWKKKQMPFYVNDVEVMAKLDPAWVVSARKHQVKNAIVHGVVDISGRLGSYFSLVNSGEDWSAKHCQILNILIPSLHVALKRVLTNEVVKKIDASKLSLREVQVIQLLQNGKTNKQMALVLGISEHTVRNHMRNAFEKLKVKNRAQAVVKAVEQGLVQA